MATNGADDNGLFHIAFFTPESDVTWWLKCLAKATADGKSVLDLTAIPVKEPSSLTGQPDEIAPVRLARALPGKDSKPIGQLKWGTGLRAAFRLLHKHDRVHREQLANEIVKEGLHPSNVTYVLGQFARRGWVEQVDDRVYAKTPEMPNKIGED